MIAFREQMDALFAKGCSAKDCKHEHGCNDVLFVHAVCHIESDIEAVYERQTGLLHLRCATCSKPIFSVPLPFKEQNAKTAAG